MVISDDPYHTDLLDCPFCGSPAAVGSTVEEDLWTVLCLHSMICPMLDVEVSSIDVYSVESKWNMRVQ